MVTDPPLVRIGEAVALHHHRGQHEAARPLFRQLWDEIDGEQGDPLYVCVLAHAIADVQDDPHQELACRSPGCIRRYTSTSLTATARSVISTRPASTWTPPGPASMRSAMTSTEN